MRHPALMILTYIIGVLTGIPLGLLLGVLCEWMAQKAFDWIWHKMGWDK